MDHLYERRNEPLISRRKFYRRVGMHFLASQVLIFGSLVVGVVGYHALARFNWIDSFLNAAMLLGGMGPVGDIPNTPGKLFAGLYALYAGLVLIAVSAVMMAPVLHRVLHRLHLEEGKTRNE